MGDELPVMGSVIDGVEMAADAFDAVGVADGEDRRGKLFGAEVEVIDGAAFIYNKFTFRDWLHKMREYFLNFCEITLILHLLKKIRPRSGPLLTGEGKRP